MKKLILIILFTNTSLLIWAQQDEEVIQNVYNQMSTAGVHEGIPYYAVNGVNGQKVSGSEYLQEDFVNGYLLTPEDKMFRIKGRFDSYNNEIQVLGENNQMLALHPHKLKAVTLNKQIFVPRVMESSGNPVWSFFELLSEGKKTLLQYYQATSQKVQGHPVLGSVNQDYKVVVNQRLYISTGRQPVQRLKKNKKSVLKALKDEKENIQSFVKEYKLSYKKTKDLIKIFDYYNQLKNEKKS